MRTSLTSVLRSGYSAGVIGGVLTPLVGRDAELARLHDAVGSAARPLEVVVRGKPGIGKTALWHDALRWLDDGSRMLLVSRPTEAESHLPYAVLMDLLADAVGDEQLARLPAPQRLAVEIALVRQVGDDGGASDLAVSAGVLRLLADLADRRPLVVALDDAQLVDMASARTLSFVLRRLGGRDVTVLSTVRSPHRSPVGHDHGGETIEIVLGGLDVDGLDDLVRAHLDRQLLLPGLIRLGRLSGGNPLAALEIARAAEDQDLDLATTVVIPADLSELLRRRLDLLSDATRSLLLHAAVAAAVDLAVLTAAAPGLDVDRMLHEAARADVLDLAGEVPRFRHPLLIEVIIAAATPGERRAAHAVLALAVDDAVERARHVAASAQGENETGAGVVERGAREALRRAAAGAAAALFEDAVRLTPIDLHSQLARRTVDAADAWVAAGSPQRAVGIARGVAAVLPRSAARGLILAALADALALVDGEPSLPVLERAAAEVEGDDAAASIVLRRLGWARHIAGDLRGGLRAVIDGIAAAERQQDPEQLASSLAAMARLSFLAGDPCALTFLQRARAVLPPGPATDARRELMHDRAVLAVWADDPDAGDLAAVERVAAQERGDAETAQYWAWYEQVVDLRTGRWSSLHGRALAREHEGRRLGIDGQTCPDLWLLADVEAHLGRVDDARRHAEAGVEAAHAQQMPVFAHWCEAVLGFLDVSVGAHGRAADRLWALYRRCEDAGIRAPGHLRHLADGVEALLAVGRRDEAAEFADHLHGLGQRTGHRWGRAAGQRCRGLVREATGDRDGAILDLRWAVELHEPLGQPFELARTLLAHGSALRRAKQKAEAREALGRAVTIFDALPAPMWADRTADEHARIGGPLGSPWELSPTERRVAELVASGRTNREVAAALVVSRKTVEWNLSKVYRKLGVRSRSELASSWSAGVGPLNSGDVPGSSRVARP
jgi:DNA-binding CsgD family transcriptional regulator